jgi:hypothetical protein
VVPALPLTDQQDEKEDIHARRLLPQAGSIFTGWNECDFVDGQPCLVTMSKARSVTVSFFGIPLW